jgi:hypothetical protein
MNTVYKYQELLGDSTIAENREDGSFIWENSFDPETGINVYELALFLPREDGLYEKSEEVHYQRAYSVEKICELLKKAGLNVVDLYDAYTWKPVSETTERVFIVAQECTKAQA